MEKLNNWLTLVTNIGVIAGLALLVYEVEQNTKALQNEADVAIYSMSADNQRLTLEHPELREMFVRIETEEWSNFSREEKMIIGTYWGNEVDRTELQFVLFKRNGTELDNIVFAEQDLSTQTFSAWWSIAKQNYASDFIEYLDGLIEKAGGIQ